jgi:ATP-binding protein involved in chromosome partitioning
MPTTEQIRKALEVVIDPELHRSIVELDMIRRIELGADGEVSVTVSLTTAGCPIRGHFQSSVRDAVMGLEGVSAVSVDFDVLDDEQKAALRAKLGGGDLPSGALAAVENVVCVGSGKGGVGKSTLTANLAAALAAEGRRVGVLDADVWGYSIPRMLGLGAQRPEVSAKRKIIPLQAGGIAVMSIGFFVEEDAAVVWRGPMLHKALKQFLEDVEWGALDFLLIDLPPGTGDVALSLIQTAPITGAVVVTTPSEVALEDARKAVLMFQQVKVELLGIIENMSFLVIPESGQKLDIFGQGGGERTAEAMGVPFLGSLPLEARVRIGGDTGRPVALAGPDDASSRRFYEIAGRLVERCGAGGVKRAPKMTIED